MPVPIQESLVCIDDTICKVSWLIRILVIQISWYFDTPEHGPRSERYAVDLSIQYFCH